MIFSEAKTAATKTKSYPLPNDPDGAMFEVTILDPSQTRKINSKAQKVVAKEGGGEMVFDTALAGEMRAFAALTGWDNIFITKEDKAAGKVMPFTALNKRQMLDGIPGLEEFILEKHSELAQERAVELETERKNLAA
ncbi:hypothetical protein [Solidesulfovibrio sp.]